MEQETPEVPIDVADISAAAADALVATVQDHLPHFVGSFLVAAGDDLAHPARVEDREDVVRRAVELALKDERLRGVIASAVLHAVTVYADVGP